jgi:hypothetical protein
MVCLKDIIYISVRSAVTRESHLDIILQVIIFYLIYNSLKSGVTW